MDEKYAQDQTIRIFLWYFFYIFKINKINFRSQLNLTQNHTSVHLIKNQNGLLVCEIGLLIFTLVVFLDSMTEG